MAQRCLTMNAGVERPTAARISPARLAAVLAILILTAGGLSAAYWVGLPQSWEPRVSDTISANSERSSDNVGAESDRGDETGSIDQSSLESGYVETVRRIIDSQHQSTVGRDRPYPQPDR